MKKNTCGSYLRKHGNSKLWAYQSLMILYKQAGKDLFIKNRSSKVTIVLLRFFMSSLMRGNNCQEIGTFHLKTIPNYNDTEFLTSIMIDLECERNPHKQPTIFFYSPNF